MHNIRTIVQPYVSSLLILLLSLSAVFGLFATPVFAADTLSSSVYIDADGDGTVDNLKWTFDDNITACVYEAGDWTVNTAGDINVAITGINTADPEGTGDGVCDGTDAVLYLSVTADTGETGGSTEPVVSYDNQGTANSLQDSGNISAKASQTQTDGAAPVIRTGGAGGFSILYGDADADAKIDSLTFFFSESVVANSVLALNDITVSNVGDFTGLAAGTDATDLIVGTVSSLTATLGTESSATDTHDDSDNLEIQMQNAFSLEDATGNTNTTTGAALAVEYDGAVPVTTDIEYQDNDGDGKIDRMVMSYSETLLSTSVLAANNFQYDTNAFFGSEFGSDATDLVTTNVSTVTVDLGTEASVNVTRDTTSVLDVSMTGTFSLRGLDGTDTTTSDAIQTVTTYSDGAAPVVTSVSPVDGATNVDITANIVMSFSEAMDNTFAEGGEFTVSPDPGSFSTSFNGSDIQVTINPDTNLACNTTYTVTTAEGAIDAAAGSPTGLLTTGPQDGDWSFTTNCGGGSNPVTPLPTYEAQLLTPNGGDAFYAHDQVDITWSTGGTGSLSYVDLWLSTDGGGSYSAIAENEVNDGSYAWSVPDIETNEALIKVEAHNNLAPLANDTSDIVFSIVAQDPVEPSEPPFTETPDGVTEPSTGETGISPFSGEVEEISVLNPGDLFRSLNYDTVYYVDENRVRRPFFNAAIYATWYDSFENIKVVTDATLPTLALGSNILPKPGVVWVKVQSLARVYVVEQNPSDSYKPTLRWITNETVAQELTGPDWADYIIDIDVTLYNRFNFGEDILNVSDAPVDLDMMKKRLELAL